MVGQKPNPYVRLPAEIVPDLSESEFFFISPHNLKEGIKAIVQTGSRIEQDRTQSTQYDSGYLQNRNPPVQPVLFTDGVQSTADTRLPAQIVPDLSESNFSLSLLIT